MQWMYFNARDIIKHFSKYIKPFPLREVPAPSFIGICDATPKGRSSVAHSSSETTRVLTTSKYTEFFLVPVSQEESQTLTPSQENASCNQLKRISNLNNRWGVLIPHEISCASWKRNGNAPCG